MSKFRKMTISVLSIILVVLISFTLPVQVAAVATPDETEGIVDSESIQQEDATSEGNVIGEDTSKRDEYTKHFITDAGTTIAAQYAVPVHYIDENGEYVDFDNSLISSQAMNSETTENEVTADEVSAYRLRTTEETEDTFTNKKSNSKVSHFKKSGKAKLVEITKDNHTISWGYSGANIVEAQEQKSNSEELVGNDAFMVLPNLSSTVLYENIYNNVDLEVINSTMGVKENLILKSSNTKNVFKIEYNIGDLVTESVDSHTIELKDADGVVVYTLSAPYMVDAEGEKSEAVELKILKNNKGKLSVKLTADKDWLKDSSRIYPVTVDPSFTYSSNTNDIMSWTYIESYNSSTDHGHEQYLYAGTYIDDEDQRTLIKINRLPSLNIGDMIVEAKANLCLIPEGLFTTTYVGAYEITKSWDEYSETWSSFGSGGYDNNLIDYEKFVNGQEAQWVDWDITELIKKWSIKPDPNDNYGFMLKVVDGTAINQNIRFASPIFGFEDDYEPLKNLRPSFTITYRNNKGLEDYWTYTPIGAGSAGTAYINDYSGNLVFQLGAASTSGLKLPASLGFTYNSYMADAAYRHLGIYVGYGWKLNYQQKVFTSDEAGLTATARDTFPYVYTDADGTDHYFYKKTDTETNTTEYLDEDGLGLKLEVGTEEYIITDESNTKRYFNKETTLLTKIKNSTNEEIVLGYVSGTNKIVTVSDANDKTIELGYGDGTYINTITDPAGRVTTLVYDSDEGYLTSVIYPDLTSVSFAYSTGGLLSSVTDIDGKKLLFEYAQGDSRGVKSVQEVAADGTYGQKITFDRTKYNTTKMQTAGVDCVFGNSDDITTIYQFDNLGRTKSVQSKNCQGEDLGASAYTYTSGEVNSTGSNIKQLNKLSSNYSLGANRENLVKNHSLDSLTNWTMENEIANALDFTAVSDDAEGTVLYGEKSLNLSVTTAVGDVKGGVYQEVPVKYLKKGEVYTFSAYVRTESLTPASGVEDYGAVLCVTPVDSDASTTDFYSEYISRNTDTSINSGFRRISVTFEVPDNSSLTKLKLQLWLHGATGTAYFDAVQLEKSDAPSSYNMLENASFERFSTTTSFENWSRLQMTDSDCKSDASVDGEYSFRISGDTANWKNLYQNVYLGSYAKETDTYILSGWATANSVPIGSNNAKFRLLARVVYDDGTYKDNGDISFNDSLQNVNWQYASGAFTLSDGDDSTDKTPEYLKIYIVYNYQGNKAYFDNLQLTKEAVPSYTYDDEGNLISVVANAEQKSTYEYENSNLTYYEDPKGYDYEYEYNDKNLLTSATTQMGAKYSYVYDTFGNATSMEGEASVGTGESGEKLYLKSEAEYSYLDEGGATYSVKTYDQDGRSMTETYDANKGTLTSTTATGNPDITTDDITTTYTYYENNDLPHTITNGNQSVSYTYDNFHKLTGIAHEGTTYSFEYDKFSNRTKTKVGNRTLATYNYAINNGNLLSMTYGNGNTQSYTYDRFGNIATLAYNGTDVAKNFADSSGAIIRAQDLLTNHEHRISYDSTGRLISKEVLDLSVTGNADKWLHSLEYNYDLNNNVSHFAFADRNTSFVTAYEYGKDNLLSKTTLANDKTVEYDYDNLGRLTGKNLNTTTPVENVYTYADSARGEVTEDGVTKKYTTTKLETETVAGTKYKYAYDVYGNITHIYSVSSNDADTLLYQYIYDTYNQLTDVYDYANSEQYEYEYDESGNITSRKHYSIGASGVPTATLDSGTYSYGDSQWKDLLTSYNGQTITYDAIGNPLNYRDGISLTWQNGRELATYSQSDTSVSYTYDVSGLRTGKTVTKDGTATEYNYVYENGLLLQMTRGSRVYDFIYDANGTPISIAYRTRATATPSYYYYGTNSRGDVTALYNSSGSITALYEYDAYGKVTVKSSNGQVNTSETHIANVNPLRYRGYVYDNETGFYYLQSRYYDPTTCRFVNGDGQLNADSFSGFNQFAYCNNNPISFIDIYGTYPTYNIEVIIDREKGTTKMFYNVPMFHIGYYGQVVSCEEVKLTEEQKAFVSTIAGEAIGANTKTQEAVAHTIMNRVNEPRDVWNNVQSVSDVLVYQQYNAVGSNQYNQMMDYLNDRTYNNLRYEMLISAVIPIYNNRGYDFTNGAHYVFNPSTSDGAWLESALLSQSDRYVQCGPFNKIDDSQYRFYRALW